MNKELLVDFAELSHLSIPCQKCQTRILLDCNDTEAHIPDECPSCGQEHERGFHS
jgi:hypothetical protein